MCRKHVEPENRSFDLFARAVGTIINEVLFAWAATYGHRTWMPTHKNTRSMDGTHTQTNNHRRLLASFCFPFDERPQPSHASPLNSLTVLSYWRTFIGSQFYPKNAWKRPTSKKNPSLPLTATSGGSKTTMWSCSPFELNHLLVVNSQASNLLKQLSLQRWWLLEQNMAHDAS